MLTAHRKKKIDTALATYDTRMTAIRLQQDVIIADFLDSLHQKRIAELRQKIKHL